MTGEKERKYSTIITAIFKQHYKKGIDSFDFKREEIETVSTRLGIKPPKNLGDLIYTYRFRQPLPKKITSTAPSGREWVILLSGIGVYKFKIVEFNRIVPKSNQLRIKIPDATPEIISKYAMNDEQALLAKVRYNRLIDIFLGITGFSLQNHLRTNVKGIGQIEIDEIYVGVNRKGTQFIVPVQAKGKTDNLSIVQSDQDIAFCENKFRNMICRPVSVQFLDDDVIAMFDLIKDGDEIRVSEEKHYLLSPAETISVEDLELYYRNER